MVRLMKCANSWLMTCLLVSSIQKRQGLLGFSRQRFTTKTEKDNAPSDNWMIMPVMPTNLQLDVLSEASASVAEDMVI